MRGGCYFPYPIRRGLLNIKNNDNLCLVYCVIAYFHSKAVPGNQKTSEVYYKKYLREFNLKGITFPIHPEGISVFEEKNKHLKFGVNVFIENNDEIFLYRPYNQVSEKQRKHVINVLLLEGISNNEERVYHYVLIENPSYFMQKKYSQRSYSNTLNCEKCFSSFRGIDKKNAHEKLCGTKRESHLIFKDHEEKIEFSKPWLKFPHLLAGFVDFESILIKQEGRNILKICFQRV